MALQPCPCPCPQTWRLPFPQGQFPEIEAIYQQMYVEFFAHLLPGIIVRQVNPVYRTEVPHCAWEVMCTFDGQLLGGLADYIHQTVENNKCTNTVIEQINFHDRQHFSVIYNVICKCNSAAFLGI
jgi:hypothetical protein